MFILSPCRNLRTSDHGQLLLNLCFALMGLYITFIIALHSREVPGVCAVVGAVLQYFFLVTFMVMAAEAIHLYMNLVIVLGMKIQYFVLKATILSWGKCDDQCRTIIIISHYSYSIVYCVVLFCSQLQKLLE